MAAIYLFIPETNVKKLVESYSDRTFLAPEVTSVHLSETVCFKMSGYGCGCFKNRYAICVK